MKSNTALDWLKATVYIDSCLLGLDWIICWCRIASHRCRSCEWCWEGSIFRQGCRGTWPCSETSTLLLRSGPTIKWLNSSFYNIINSKSNEIWKQAEEKKEKQTKTRFRRTTIRSRWTVVSGGQPSQAWRRRRLKEVRLKETSQTRGWWDHGWKCWWPFAIPLLVFKIGFPSPSHHLLPSFHCEECNVHHEPHPGVGLRGWNHLHLHEISAERIHLELFPLRTPK